MNAGILHIDTTPPCAEHDSDLDSAAEASGFNSTAMRRCRQIRRRVNTGF